MIGSEFVWITKVPVRTVSYSYSSQMYNDIVSTLIVSTPCLLTFQYFSSVADPDPGSGAFFDPWIRDPEEVFSGSRIPNPYF
jgi:hypothetical protein